MLSLGRVLGELLLLGDPYSGILRGGLDQTKTSSQLVRGRRSGGEGSRAGENRAEGRETHDD